MNNPISEQEFDELLSKHGKSDSISEKSPSPISLDEFDRMISEKEQPQSEMNWQKQLLNAMQQASSNVPKFVENHQLNKENINDFIEKSLGGIGMESPALGRGLAKGAKYLGEKLSPIVGKFTGKEAAGKAENLIQNLSKETPLSEYHQPIVNKIRKLHEADIAEGKENFNAIGENSESRGIGSVDKDTLDTLRRLKIRENSEPALYERIKRFRENPSYQQAHELQSELGNVGASKVKSLDTAQKELGRKLLKTRNELRGDIIENFERHGAEDLAKDYKNATEFWKNRVKIYDKNKAIKDIVKKTGIEEINPTNIGNILTKDSATTRYVLSKLPQEEKNLILANKLKNKTPQEIIEKFNELKNSPYAKLITPEHENVFTDLEKSVEFANKFGKRALKAGAKSGAGLLALLGLDKAGRYTGIL